MENLERLQAVVLEIADEVNRGHALTTELAFEQVAGSQAGLEPF